LVAAGNEEIGSEVKVWTSGNYSHPVLTGFSNVQYVLNHNQGDQPDLVTCLIWGGSSVGFIAMEDVWETGSTRYGYEPEWNLETDKDSTHIRVFRIGNTTKTIRLRAFWF
jgi:hypothetical protein